MQPQLNFLGPSRRKLCALVPLESVSSMAKQEESTTPLTEALLLCEEGDSNPLLRETVAPKADSSCDVCSASFCWEETM